MTSTANLQVTNIPIKIFNINNVFLICRDFISPTDK